MVIFLCCVLKMYFRVCCVVVFLISAFGQDLEDIAITETTTVAQIATTLEYQPAIVCSICACDGSTINCGNRNIQEAFTIEEWNGISNLEIINADLSGNTFNVLQQFPSLSIEKLNLSNCNIEKIENVCFKYLQNLTVLDLKGNHLSSLNEASFWGLLLPDHTFKKFEKMRYLTLAYNDLHALPKDAFNFMPDLTFLDLSRNPLRVIDQVTMSSLSGLVVLKELRLSSCELETLPEGLLRRQRKLQRLDISNNKFKTIPSVLDEANNLIYLNFDRNPINSLTEKTSISSLSKLQELSLCGTKLQSIDASSLGGLESLISLHIANNPKLRWIDEDFLSWEDQEETKRWPVLKEIYLNKNNISSINPHILHRWDKLEVMDFADNPYVCECSNQWMVDVLVPLILSRNGTADDMICSKPHELRGLSFSKLHELNKTLFCIQAENLKIRPGPDLALILGIIIGIFLTFPLVLIIVLLWRKGSFARCRQKLNSEEDSDEETDAF